MSIEISNVSKIFDCVKVLDNVSLYINSGEMIALLGPSGSGKTTLLRIIAGLECYNSGHLRFGGKDVGSLHVRERRVGFVFQNYALFRHMTVANNVAFGMKVLPKHARPRLAVIKHKVFQLLEMVKLNHLADRYPSQLSGGQKQRVALARALSVEPDILLLDEPFGALDTRVRQKLRRWLRELHQELKFTSIFVTHDQEESMEVANRIVIMNQGNIEQVGTPQDVWRLPASRFVLEFFGDINKLAGEIRGSQLFVGVYHWPLLHNVNFQGNIDIFLRPWEIYMSKYPEGFNILPIQVVDVNLRGHYWQLIAQSVGGWHKELLTLIVSDNNINNIPHKGDRRYISVQNARLYSGEEVLHGSL